MFTRILTTTLCVVEAIFATASCAQTTDLKLFYQDFAGSVRFDDLRSPRIDFTGNAIRPINASVQAATGETVTPAPYERWALFRYYSMSVSNALYGFREGVCNSFFVLPTSVFAGQVVTVSSNVWRADNSDGKTYISYTEGVCDDFSSPPLNLVPHRFTDDQLNIGAPIRRTAIDGGQYDASPLKITRNGLPWYTYYMAYKLGPVANESDWDDANLTKAGDLVGFFRFPTPNNNFNLAYLPAPWVEDDVVEYVNRADFPNQPDGQFFYAVLASDKLLLDSAKNWSRTGNTFKSGGYVSVCRFYGGKNGGPNTHFYSSDDKECAALKKVTALSYEGQTFAVNAPMPAKTAEQNMPGATRDCPINSVPLYRLYNNASKSGGRFVSNHRYTVDQSDVAAFVAKGWVDEGHAMCVPK